MMIVCYILIIVLLNYFVFKRIFAGLQERYSHPSRDS